MKLFRRIIASIVSYCADVDSITQQRTCVLLQLDIVAFLLSLLVGFFALYYEHLPITNSEVWSSFVVTIGTGISGVVMLRGLYNPAAHIAVFFAFVGIWAQVFSRAGMLTTQSAVAYVVALLAFPALLLGRGWTLLYGAATVVMAGVTSAHIVLAHHFTSRDAAAFGIDIVASAAFVIYFTGLLSRMYESSLNRVRGLLGVQQEQLAQLRQLSESLQQTEAHKRQFYRDTIYSVTSGKLSICEENDLEPYFEQCQFAADLPEPTALAGVRHQVLAFCVANGITGKALELLGVGVGEAMTNAIKHAGRGRVCAGATEGAIWVAVSDDGPGIESLILPRAVLLAGFSTKPSLGLGYTIMLDVADQILLKTSDTGTIVMLIKYTDESRVNEPIYRGSESSQDN